MQEVVLVHDDPRIARLVADVLRSQGFAVKSVRYCEGPDDLERIRNEADAPLVIRTAHARSYATALV